MAYIPIVPQRIIEITQLFSVHYFEYTSSYRFSGESHDFWELLYVDNGAVQVVAGEETHSLSRGQMIFHQPGEFHALSANGAVAPNLVVVSFQCRSPAMDFFRRRILFAGAAERALLARAVEESPQLSMDRGRGRKPVSLCSGFRVSMSWLMESHRACFSSRVIGYLPQKI